ncbi:glutathione S-transferase [Aspergillus sclerotioniger CBS 115572]|uniref:Glutathione S-transferase n=1 Tax=Aspergillus sclerotioniger CBS 115572 TaxID=1450535 RepID=A0A317WVG4_9EURO|nr:glutathione S-transferase [Aspergillus sclerotioniger CBS 115572]PWY90343.1 glutathione S-transferase [Aspergillus sclerotioniger CBS 115572]
MPPFGHIYTFTRVPNPRLMKIQATANLNHLTLTLPPSFTMRKDNKSPEFLADFPMGKVPTFRGSDGLLLFESDAITRYIAEHGPASAQLLGRTPTQRALIQQWICFASNEIMEAVVPCVLWRMGRREYNETIERVALERLERGLNCFEECLKRRRRGQEWMVRGEREGDEGELTLADISLASAMYWPFAFVVDREMRRKYPGIVEWYLRTIGMEGVREAFGEVNFVEKRRVHGDEDEDTGTLQAL